MNRIIIIMLNVIILLTGSFITEAQKTESPISLVGTYRLVSFETRYEKGDIQYPFGKDAVGQLSYDSAGNMSAFVMQPDRPKFTSGDRLQGTDAEVRAAFEGFVGYFGTYTVNAVKGTVTHHVLGAFLPNWVGGDQIRYYKIEGVRLTLSMPPSLSGGQRSENIIVWERIK